MEGGAGEHLSVSAAYSRVNVVLKYSGLLQAASATNTVLCMFADVWSACKELCCLYYTAPN
jgi:hypothetical protein